MSRNSITPSRAFLTIGELVFTTGDWPSGPGRRSLTCIAQEATGFGGPPTTSTRHIRQLPAMRQTLVIAEARHLDAGHFAGLEERHRPIHLDLVAVDDDLFQVAHVKPFRPAGPCPPNPFWRCAASLHQLPLGSSPSMTSATATRPPAKAAPRTAIRHRSRRDQREIFLSIPSLGIVRPHCSHVKPPKRGACTWPQCGHTPSFGPDVENRS